MSSNELIVLIITHGNFAQELVNTAEMIVGDVSDVFYINFTKDMTPDALKKEVEKIVTNDKNILIFTDLFGGTCFNVAGEFLVNENVEVIAGVNLPLLLEVILTKKIMDFSALVSHLKIKAPESIIFVKDKLNEKK